MEESDFEGTLVLEQLAAIDKTTFSMPSIPMTSSVPLG
jgi:hypothetical protein